MKIIRVEHLSNMGGGTEAWDIRLDNHYAIRIFEGMAYLFTRPSDNLDDDNYSQAVAILEA